MSDITDLTPTTGGSEHPDDLLSALADGELDVAEVVEVEAHVAGCSACGAELADIARVRSIMRRAPVLEAPEGLVDRLVKRRKRASRHGVILGAAAAIVAVMASVALADPADRSAPEKDNQIYDAMTEEGMARFGLEGGSSQREDSGDPSLADRAEEAARDLLGFLTGE